MYPRRIRKCVVPPLQRIAIASALVVVVGGLSVAGGVALAAQETAEAETGVTVSPPVAAAPESTPNTARAVPSSDGSAFQSVASDPAVQAQLAYALAHWSDYNFDDYGTLVGNDCVNFASQSLIVRGWQMDDDWWTNGTGAEFAHSSAWVSSTAFHDYLEESGRATALSDAQRDQVKLGDIVQFDWDNSGDRDHTGIVTGVEVANGQTTIRFAGHTEDSDYRSVDAAITVDHPGASVYYWSIP